MKKRILALLLAAVLTAFLTPTAFAAQQTVYLDGFDFTKKGEWQIPPTVESTAEMSQFSVTGENLRKTGSVAFPDDYPPVPIYSADGPVTVTLISGQNADGSFVPNNPGPRIGFPELEVDELHVSVWEYDPAAQTFTATDKEAPGFDGYVGGYHSVEEDDFEVIGTIQQMRDGTLEDDDFLGPCFVNGAAVTLTEPGIYLVGMSLRTLGGFCNLFVTVTDTTADPGPVIPESPAFTDVPANAYYADAVAWAVENGVTNGATSTTFDPDGDCTRAQIVTFLWRAYDEPEPKSTVSPFTDVTDPGAYYYKAVLWAVENGVTDGKSLTVFDPNGTCTRGQAVTFLWRAAEKPSASGGSAFTDVTDPGAYYYDAVQWAVENHITDGKTPTTFAPGETCTRGQIVTFLFRDLAE